MIDRNRNSCSCREFRLFLEEIHQFLVCQEFLKGIPAGIPEIFEHNPPGLPGLSVSHLGCHMDHSFSKYIHLLGRTILIAKIDGGIYPSLNYRKTPDKKTPHGMCIKRADAVMYFLRETEPAFELGKSCTIPIHDHCATGSRIHVRFSTCDLFVSVSLVRSFLLPKHPNAMNGKMKAC